MVPLFPALIILVLVLVIIWAIYRALTPRALPGPVVAVDGSVTSVTVGRVATMSSQVHGLVGRPDELRRSPDGRVVPVEVKSSRDPRPGAHPTSPTSSSSTPTARSSRTSRG